MTASTASGPAVQPIPIEKIKESMRATWMAGDFGVVARRTAADAEAFVSRLGLAQETRVLDVACGTGNLAVPLARQGCVVTGVDIAANLLVQARERASAEGLTIKFDEGDAEALPYTAESFDGVVSMFGAMFAPRPELVASELARVLRPGGVLAMGNWTPASFTGEMFRVGSKHAPGPAGIAPPILWGDEAMVRERLAPFFTDIQTQVVPIDFDLPTNPAGAVEFFRTYFGPTKVAFSRLDEAGQSRLAADLEALWSGANISTNPSSHTLIRNEYLLVNAKRL
jgi:ubiquinone/menaquinone biosynthesis C-methylase UbiE